MRTCVLFLVCPLPCVLCSLPRLTVLLPALPDVHLSAQREVQVQPPVRLPLGDRGHIRLRDTPHNNTHVNPVHNAQFETVRTRLCCITAIPSSVEELKRASTTTKSMNWI